MAVVLPEKFDAWTVDDLPDDGRRYEIVDGTLLLSPHPTWRHDSVAFRLYDVLRAALDGVWRVVGPTGVSFSTTSYRVPDLLVLPESRELSGIAAITPRDVELVVEVVSPGSVSTDRVTKPAQYAAAAIPGFWRVEIEPSLSLTAYVLRDGAEVYAEIGHWGEGETVQVTEPFAVSFALDDLRR